MSTRSFSDAERRAFLNHLDSAPIDVTEWEARFIEDTFDRTGLSYKQRQIVDGMIERYGEEIGF